MSKEQEAVQQQQASGYQGSSPGYQQPYPAQQAHHGQQIFPGSNLQPGQTYNTIMPGTCAVPGPIANPVFQQPGPILRVSDKKSVIEAYLIWLIFGLIGGHHFYLRRYGFGVLYFFTFGLCGIGFVIDLFRMPYLVSMANKRSADYSLEHKKNISDAYTLWFPMGLFGFHHFYLGNHGLGVFYLFSLGGFGIGWLIDLFLIPGMVRKYNTKSKMELETKSVCTAYVIGVSPAGLLGFHHFYLGRPLWGLLYFLTFGIFGLGWLIDWFRIPLLVQRKNKELSSQQKDDTKYLDDAYILWFPLGFTGIHNLYLERWGMALFYFFTFGALGLGWIIDGLRMPCLVKNTNKRKQEQRLIPAYVHTTGYTIAYPGSNPVYAPPGPAQYPKHQLPSHATQLNPPSYQDSTQPAPTYMEQPPPYTPAGDQ